MLGPSAREVVHQFASRMAAHTCSGVVRLVQKRRQMLSQHLVEDVFARHAGGVEYAATDP